MRNRRELEFKVQLAKGDLAKLSRSLRVKDIDAGQPSRRELRSTYFDTPQRDLHKAGLSLRVRRDANRWIQTLKAEQGVKRGLSNPVELETDVSGERPNLEAIRDPHYARSLRKIIGKAELEPVFETIVQRTTRRIKASGAEIELALDAGEVRAHGARQEICEAEFELKRGSVSGLVTAAEVLLRKQKFDLSTRSKSERGYELAGARRATNGAAEVPKEIHADLSCGEAFSILLERAARQIIENKQAVLDSDDPRGAHQMRVGLRRLRSVLRALRHFVDTPLLMKFDAIARDMARWLGELRDADALISAIHAPVEEAVGEQGGFKELKRTLVQRRQAKQASIRSLLKSGRWSMLQLYLSLWPQVLAEHKALERPLLGSARKVLKQRWKKLRKQGSKLDELSIEERHELRKSLKHLRYISEFFAPAFQKEKTTSRFMRRLKELQDVFGYMNDVNMAGQLKSIAEATKGATALAAHYIMGWHEAETRHVWMHASHAWKQLERTPKFWT
jgi:inorganic triphosphatase YgiF